MIQNRGAALLPTLQLLIIVYENTSVYVSQETIETSCSSSQLGLVTPFWDIVHKSICSRDKGTFDDSVLSGGLLKVCAPRRLFPCWTTAGSESNYIKFNWPTLSSLVLRSSDNRRRRQMMIPVEPDVSISFAPVRRIHGLSWFQNLYFARVQFDSFTFIQILMWVVRCWVRLQLELPR